MSAGSLRDRVAEVIRQHRYDPYLRQCLDRKGLPGCTWKPRGRKVAGSDQHAQHRSDVMLAEVRTWLTSPDTRRVVELELYGRIAPAGARAALEALANQVVTP